MKPTLSTSSSSSARSRPSKAVGPSLWTRLRTPSGRPPAMNSRASASPSAGEYSAGFQTTALPHRIAGHEVPRGHRHREVAGRDDRGDANRVAEGEELLVGHLARNGLPVEAPALGEEEVAGVDDLLHLAERLGVGLADLARDEPRERLLVVLDDAADLLDRRCRARAPARPPSSRCASRAARQASTKVSASPSTASQIEVLEVRGVARLDPLARRCGPRRRRSNRQSSSP